MTTFYVRIDDGFPEHPKALGLPEAALWLWVDGLLYAHRHRTDGHVPTRFVGRKRAGHAAALTKARLWVTDPDGDGWLIHGYLDWYPSRAELETRDRARSDRARRAAKARWEKGPDAMHAQAMPNDDE